MKVASKLGKICTVALGCMLAVGISLGVSGCSNDKQVITDGLTEMFDAFKDPSVDSLKEVMQKEGATDEELASFEESFSEMDQLGISADDLLHYLFLDFDYQIGEVQVDGSTATAEVTVTSKDFKAAGEAFSDYLDSDEGKAELLQALTDASGDESALYKFIFEKLFAYIEQADDTEQSMTLKLTKTDNEWDIDDDSMTDLTNLLFGGLDDVTSASSSM